MRTTLDIDDELLSAVREIARRQNKTAGDVVSDLLRESLQSKSYKQEYRNGIPILQRRPHCVRVTSELVSRLAIRTNETILPTNFTIRRTNGVRVTGNMAGPPAR